ncbi:hypothetical protein EDB89DRAFT_891859 [Lactarius sanguifluus]|nr:hypothetical protein EDB89DRAFT_891859 [Lactarius sanguifluus]
MSVFSRSASRVPQATLVLSLSIPFLILPGANAAPTSDPSTTAPATSPLDERAADEPTHKSSGLSVPALLAILAVSLVVLLLGATLAYLYVRRRRVHQKRASHRKRTAQFQEMHRTGARPYHAGGCARVAATLCDGEWDDGVVGRKGAAVPDQGVRRVGPARAMQNLIIIIWL